MARDWDKLRRADKARKKVPLSKHKAPSYLWAPHQPTAYELANGLYPGSRRRRHGR